MSIDFNQLSLRDTLDLAIYVEEEAKDRYEDFAKQMDVHHTPEVAEFFRFMAANELKHAEKLSAQRASLFGNEPSTADTSMLFDIEAPEFDAARAFLHGIDNFESMRGGPYNVGLSDANLSKMELCERIARHVPGFVFMEAAIGEDPDKRDYLVSNEKIERTGYRPKFSLDDGIRELVKGYAMLRNAVYGNI